MLMGALPWLVAVSALARPAGAQAAPPSLAPAVRITEQTSGTPKLLQAVHAVSERVVWASGHGGMVLRSVDGGDRWEARPTASGDSLEFRDVHAIDADTAWIMSSGSGAKSRIYRTTNGGASWTLQFMNPDTAAFYDCLSFGRGRGRTGIRAGNTAGISASISTGTGAYACPDAGPEPCTNRSTGADGFAGDLARAVSTTRFTA